MGSGLSATIEGRIAMAERVIINIKTFADGHRPPHRVIGEMLGASGRPTAPHFCRACGAPLVPMAGYELMIKTKQMVS